MKNKKKNLNGSDEVLKLHLNYFVRHHPIRIKMEAKLKKIIEDIDKKALKKLKGNK